MGPSTFDNVCDHYSDSCIFSSRKVFFFFFHLGAYSLIKQFWNSSEVYKFPAETGRKTRRVFCNDGINSEDRKKRGESKEPSGNLAMGKQFTVCNVFFRTWFLREFDVWNLVLIQTFFPVGVRHGAIAGKRSCIRRVRQYCSTRAGNKTTSGMVADVSEVTAFVNLFFLAITRLTSFYYPLVSVVVRSVAVLHTDLGQVCHQKQQRNSKNIALTGNPPLNSVGIASMHNVLSHPFMVIPFFFSMIPMSFPPFLLLY